MSEEGSGCLARLLRTAFLPGWEPDEAILCWRGTLLLDKPATQKAFGGKMKGQAILPDLQRGQARDKAAEMVGTNPHYVTDAKKSVRDAPEILALLF